MPESAPLLEVNENGLFCRAGGFHIDPWRPVERALITHAHSDHASVGSRAYLCSTEGAGVLRERIGESARIEGLPWGDSLDLNGVKVSFHPAGHVLGSAQIRVEYQGEIWVVSGDYKTHRDPTCAAFEPVRCHTFVTESTFGLPIYRWSDPEKVFERINDWWRTNQEQGRVTVLYGYSLGKAQRLLAGVDPSIGPIFVHGAVQKFLPAYAQAGIRLPPVQPASKENVRASENRGLVVAPPAADSGAWVNSLGDVSTAFASGWMLVRGTRRRLSADRGFALSDHADWPGLLASIRATGAERILVTHGYTGPLVRWLRETGMNAEALRTRFSGNDGEELERPDPIS